MHASTALLPARLPPGPRSLPLLGALPFLFRGPTHHSLSRLARQYGDVCLFHIGSDPTVVISHPRILADAFGQADAWDQDDSRLPCSSGEERRHYLDRFAAEKLFSAEACRMVERHQVEPLAAELAQRLEHLAEAGKRVNPLLDLEYLDFSLAFRAIFGAGSRDALDFLTLKGQLRELVSWSRAAEPPPLPDFFSWLRGYTKKLERENELLLPALDKVVGGLVKGVSRRPEFDLSRPTCLAEVLLSAQGAGDLDWDEVRSLCTGLLSAAPAGLGKTLSWFLLLLANRPEVQANIHEELDRVLGREAVPAAEDRAHLPFTHACLSETARYRTLLPLSPPRRTARATEVGGYHVPAGARVLGNVHAINHDHRFWAAPLRFLPERFLPRPDGTPPSAPAAAAFTSPMAVPDPFAGHRPGQSAAWLHAARLLSRLKFETPDGAPLSEIEVLDRTIAPRPYELKPVRR